MARQPTPRPNVDEAIALMQQGRTRGRGRRSPIMVWMQQNRTALETAFAQTAPAWAILASYLGERGITDGDGKPPTARTAREAWGRVKADAKARSEPAGATTDPAMRATPMQAVAPAATAAAPAPPVQEGAEPPRPRFGMATLRNHTPLAPPSPSPLSAPAAPRQDSKAVIEALLSRGRPTGFRKPESKDE